MIAGGEPAGLQGQNRTWVRDDSKQEGNQLGYRVRIELGSGMIAGGESAGLESPNRTWVRVRDDSRGVRWEQAGLEGPNRTWVRDDSRRGASWVTGLE